MFVCQLRLHCDLLKIHLPPPSAILPPRSMAAGGVGGEG